MTELPRLPFHLDGFLPEIPLGLGFSVPTYYLIISATFCFCVLWLVKRTERAALSRETVLDLSLIIMGGGFIGARLAHVLIEAPAYYAADWTRVLEIWQGGFVFYGGAISGSLLAVAYLHVRKKWDARWLDVFAPVGAAGYTLGRIACWLTGCCFGRVLEFGSVTFVFPTQLFAVFTEALTLTLLLWLERGAGLWSRNTSHQWGGRRLVALLNLVKRPGTLFSIWLIFHGVNRVFMEALRADDRGFAPLGVSASTWISFVLVAIGVVRLRQTAGDTPNFT